MATLDEGYRLAHKAVWSTKGNAKEKTCISCGGQAYEWAYQHTAEDPQVGGGFEYSDNPDDYEPMCRSCHRKMDYEHHTPEAKDARTKNMREALAERHREDPTFNMPTRTCVCGMKSSAPAIGTHQKFTGHVGYQEETC